MAQDDYAVVVGIAGYPKLGDLDGTENDAIAFSEWLVSADGGDVPRQNVKLVLSSDYPYNGRPTEALPTTALVDQKFDELIEDGLGQGGRLGRRLYMFFAGHGIAPDIDETALLMANAAVPVRTGHHIPARAYAKWFRRAE